MNRMQSNQLCFYLEARTCIRIDNQRWIGNFHLRNWNYELLKTPSKILHEDVDNRLSLLTSITCFWKHRDYANLLFTIDIINSILHQYLIPNENCKLIHSEATEYISGPLENEWKLYSSVTKHIWKQEVYLKILFFYIRSSGLWPGNLCENISLSTFRPLLWRPSSGDNVKLAKSR